MFLALIGLNFFINKKDIHDAALSVIALKDEGTSLDINGDVIYNEVDNYRFKDACKDCLSKTTKLDYSDLRELMKCWNWDIFEDINGHITDIEFASADYIIDEKSEDIIVFRVLAQYVVDRSYLLFCKEDFNNAFDKNNLNFMKWEFMLGTVSILDCVNINFGFIPNSEYDCFNQIKPTYLNLSINKGNYPVKYNSVPTIITKSINISTPTTVATKAVKYGGFCKKCKLYDDYAIQNDLGEVLCYKCISN